MQVDISWKLYPTGRGIPYSAPSPTVLGERVGVRGDSLPCRGRNFPRGIPSPTPPAPPPPAHGGRPRTSTSPFASTTSHGYSVVVAHERGTRVPRLKLCPNFCSMARPSLLA